MHRLRWIVAMLAIGLWAGSAVRAERVTIVPIQPRVIRVNNIQMSPIRLERIMILPMALTPVTFPAIQGIQVHGMVTGFEVLHPTIMNPENVHPSLIGSNVDRNSLKGIRFEDLYVADADMQVGAKDYATLSRDELARFGVSGQAVSSLENQLFPHQKEMVLAREPSSNFPVSLYSIDEALQIEG